MFTTNENKPRPILLAGLILMVVGLPVSLFLTSLSQFVLAGSFFLEGNFLEKFRRFFRNRIALLTAGIWFIHLIGLLWTTDMAEGLKDLRIKLPVLILPIILSGSRPLSKKEFKAVLLFFISGVLAGTLISIAVLTGIIPREIRDIRDIFIFNISHIRFALFTCLSIIGCGWLAFKNGLSNSDGWKPLYLLLMAWFIAFLIIAESVTGIIILIILALAGLAVTGIRSKKTAVKLASFMLLAAVPFVIFLAGEKLHDEFNRKQPLVYSFSDTTAEGNTYYFDLEHTGYENGYPVWIYICDPELQREWEKASDIPYDSLDNRGQPVRYTIIRYLASKGLRKDAAGFSSLSPNEIKNIENGIANSELINGPGLWTRLKEVAWEIEQYRAGADPSGHSVTQRLEFWKAAIHLIRKSPLTGTGTGDMPAEFKKSYKELKSQLQPEFQLRSHNQFLAVTVALGLAGLLYFMIALFYPLTIASLRADWLFTGFWLIFFLSMLTEDTLETQPGATFYGLFLSLLTFTRTDHSDRETG